MQYTTTRFIPHPSGASWSSTTPGTSSVALLSEDIQNQKGWQHAPISSTSWNRFQRVAALWTRVSQPFSNAESQSTSIEKEIERVLLDLKSQVRLQHIDRIRAYLAQYPELLDVLPRAVDAARSHFPQAQLILDIYQDPEIEDHYLVIYVRLHEYNDEILEQMERAEQEFMRELASKEGWIQLTTDFRVPEEEDAL